MVTFAKKTLQVFFAVVVILLAACGQKSEEAPVVDSNAALLKRLTAVEESQRQFTAVTSATNKSLEDSVKKLKSDVLSLEEAVDKMKKEGCKCASASRPAPAAKPKPPAAVRPAAVVPTPRPAVVAPGSVQRSAPAAVVRKRETNPDMSPSGICGIVAEDANQKPIAYFMLQPYQGEGEKKGNLQIMQVKEMKKGVVERVEGAITGVRHTDCQAALRYVESNWAKVVERFKLPNTCLPLRKES